MRGFFVEDDLNKRFFETLFNQMRFLFKSLTPRTNYGKYEILFFGFSG